MATSARTLTTDALLALCRRLGNPANRIHAIDSLPQPPHLQAVGLFPPQRQPPHHHHGGATTTRPATRWRPQPAVPRPAALREFQRPESQRCKCLAATAGIHPA